jgi:nucleoid-associated protein YgaU
MSRLPIGNPPATVILTESSRHKDTPVLRVLSIGPEFELWLSSNALRGGDDFSVHQVAERERGRLDLIAHKFYGNPLYWWIIAHANDVIDPIGDITTGQFLRIPAASLVDQFVQRRKRSVS